MKTIAEGEILKTLMNSPRLHETPGYSVNLFTGIRLEIAQAIYDIWKEETIDNSAIPVHRVSIESAIPEEDILIEIDGFDPLPLNIFPLTIKIAALKKKTKRLQRLVMNEEALLKKSSMGSPYNWLQIQEAALEIATFMESIGSINSFSGPPPVNPSRPN